MAVRFLARIFLTALAAVSLSCGAAPFSVPLGGDRLILDTPVGVSDALPLSSPRLNELADSLTSASNRILLFGITDADLRRFTTGERLELKRYLIAVTPRSLERENVSLVMFERYIQDVTREIGSPAKNADYMKFLETQPPGEAKLLAELRRDSSGVILLQGMRLPDSGRFFEKPTFMLVSTALLRLRGKAISLQVYASYEGPQDLDWLRFVTGRWIEDIERLNR